MLTSATRPVPISNRAVKTTCSGRGRLVPHRDYASVVRDILQPSAALNPDYLNFQALLKDGRTLAGVVLSSDDKRLVLGDNTGKEITIPANEIDSLAPAALSVMPDNFRELLSEKELADLMAFLLTQPPSD